MPKITGTLTATGQTPWVQVEKKFNIALWGTFSATLQLERSFDDGVTALPCSLNSSGDVASYTGPLSATVEEPEGGVMYRWNCTNYTSGTVNYRISQ